MRAAILGALVLVLLVGATLTGLSWSRGTAAGELTPADIKSATHIHGSEMPGWLKTADVGIKREYLWAADNWEILRYMPCYCGCGQDPFDHRNNYACYFKYDEKGNITGFDDHGYG